MKPLFLELPPEPQQPTLSYESKIFALGSCFVENIGEKLLYHKFQAAVNPFGILFHPQAILSLVQRMVEQRQFTEQDVFLHNEQWHCFEVHSILSNSNKVAFLENLNQLVAISYRHLKESTHILLTFGTAWGYWHKETQQLVANCHKIPQRQFDKKLSEVTGLENIFSSIFDLIQQLNPRAQIITTVSPVRHIKDGIVANNQSKAHLLAALHKSAKQNAQVHYYPAYELVTDCLRDYRFYKADLIHPNQIAIDFVWEHFRNAWLHDSETTKTLKRVAEIQRGLAHKPFNPTSEAHQKFVALLNEKILVLEEIFPFIKF